MNYRDKERVLTSKLVQNFAYRGAHMGRPLYYVMVWLYRSPNPVGGGEAIFSLPIVITASHGNVSVGRGDSSLQIYIVSGIYIYVGE